MGRQIEGGGISTWKKYQMNIISFSLTLVHYAAALLVSQRNSKTEGMSRELLVFIRQEQIKLERRQSQRSKTWETFTRYLSSREYKTL